MRVAVQRRTIELGPPDDADLEWLLASGVPSSPFGDAPAKEVIVRARAAGLLVVGVIRASATNERIGYVIAFPPMAGSDAWEIVIAIPDTKKRDGFSALYAIDAIAYHLFEHRNVSAVGCRIRDDNPASSAIARRLGQSPFEERTIDGRVHRLYRMDRDQWSARRAKIERGATGFSVRPSPSQVTS